MDFCDQCESTQRGSVGPSSSQLMCLKGNYHWCCFPFLSGQRSSRSCHGTARHTGGTLLQSSLFTHKAPGQGEEDGEEQQWMWGGLAVVNLTYPLSGSLLLELIVNPIKAGDRAYWFTPLNTDNKQIQREYILCGFTHKWLLCPQNIHII